MYLPTITQNGKTLLIETENIDNIQLLQPLNLGGSEKGYVVLISYKDGSREQLAIKESTWISWNEERKGDNSAKDNQ